MGLASSKPLPIQNTVWTCIYASSEIGTHDPIVRAVEDSTRICPVAIIPYV
jgi:hypothetical protein